MENRAWARCGSLNILPSSFSFQGALESGVVPASLHSFHRSPKPRCLGVRRRPFPSANRDQSPFNFESAGRQKAWQAGSSKASVNAWGGRTLRCGSQPWKSPSAHHTHEHTSHVDGLKDLNA